MTPSEARRGVLRIYLGAAPGVGKTFAMLNEGHRRRERGTDVVVGIVETHGRARTAEQLGDLEVIPRRTVEHRETSVQEMDVDAVLARNPDLVLVDELAHTNAPGSRHDKRWQDVDELLAAGIDVISTVNVQHLESLNDVVERITGIRQRETVPDHVVRAADQIELVDMAPEALRRRLAHGNVYGADRIDAALGNYFRPGNLAALRELALLWVADRVDDGLQDYRDRHGITQPWETRERVVVALAGAPDTDHLVRRAARIAQRAKGDLIGVHVVADTGLSDGRDDQSVADKAAQRRLIEELGGEYRRIVSNDVAAALVELARAENATQIVLGATARSRWQELFGGSIINRVVRLSGPIDVHVISRPSSDVGERGSRLPAMGSVLTPLSPRRQLWGWAIALGGLPALTVLLTNTRDTFGLASALLLYLMLAIVVAFVGGTLPAVAAVIGGLLLADWYFTPPFYGFTITDSDNVIALVVYAVSAGLVAVLVDRVGRSRVRSVRLQAEAEALASLAGALTSATSLEDTLGRLRVTFAFDSVSLWRRESPDWTLIATSGAAPPEVPTRADASRDLGRGITLAFDGGELTAADNRVLGAFTAQLANAAEHDRLQSEAHKAGELAATNRLRGSILQAVSHDLRTPLAAIKAAASSLRQQDIDWPPEVVEDFEATIEEEADRLSTIVDNLLDMSRLQSEALTLALRPAGADEVVLAAIASLGEIGRAVATDLPDSLPEVLIAPELIERSLANLISNAARHSPADAPVIVSAGMVGGHGDQRVDIRVIDRGPGIRPGDRELVFQPFQRLVDHQADGTGIGLGLAVARGFVEAVGGELTIEDTPGGGTTMVVSLPVASPVPPPADG